jgi:hypothetical protein
MSLFLERAISWIVSNVPIPLATSALGEESEMAGFFGDLTAFNVLTAVVAVGGIGLSIAALRQNSKHHAKPKMEYEWLPEVWDMYEAVWATLVVSNEGTADAITVRARLETDTRDDQWLLYMAAIGRGVHRDVSVPLTPTKYKYDPHGNLQRVGLGHTEVQLSRPVVVVEIAGVRTKRLRAPWFKVGANRVFTMSVDATDYSSHWSDPD